MLFIARVEARLGKEGDVAEPVLAVRIATVEKGRQVDDQLGVALRDQLQPLAVAIIPGVVTRGARLPDEVAAELLLQSRRNRDQRRDPVRLLALGRGGARLVAFDEAGLAPALLSLGGNRCGKNGEQKQRNSAAQNRMRAERRNYERFHDSILNIFSIRI